MSESLGHEVHPAQPIQARGGRPHVLVIDDHAVSRSICAGYLDLFDHTSRCVSRGAEAVAALQRERFSVVVMNLHMENASGLETLRAIRALPGSAGEAPIIGLTAAGRADEAQRWLAAGLAAVAPKPITAAKLFAALGAALSREEDPARSWAPAR